MPVRRERWRVEIERGEADAPRHGPDRPEPSDRENRTAAHADSDSDSCEVLADPERLAAEHQTYRAIVGRDYGAARDQWAEAVPELGAAWEKIKEKYGYEEREEPTPQADGGAWHGKGGRRLDAAQNQEIDRGYARIREAGERTIIPGILSVETEDPTRRLAGFDNRFKGEDRLKEKIADRIRSKGRTQRKRLPEYPTLCGSPTSTARPRTRRVCSKICSALEPRGSLSLNAAIHGTMTSTRA